MKTCLTIKWQIRLCVLFHEHEIESPEHLFFTVMRLRSFGMISTLG